VCGTSLTAEQATELVGARIDPGRGDRFAPLPEPPPTHTLRYRVAWVAKLPRTSHRSDARCMKRARRPQPTPAAPVRPAPRRPAVLLVPPGRLA
jgi:hypothetical protein